MDDRTTSPTRRDPYIAPTDGLEHIGSILRRWVLELMERAGVTEDEQLALFDERP